MESPISKRPISVKWILILSLLITAKIVVNELTQENIFTDDLYRDTFTYLAGEERVEAFLENRNNNTFRSSVFFLWKELLKLLLLTIAVLMGFALFRAKIHFSDVFKSVMVAEFIMLAPSVIRLIWFTHYEELIVIGDFNAFSPWSLHHYLSNYNVPIFILNLSLFVNVFELLFLTTIVYRIKQHTKFSYAKTLKYTLFGYVPLLAIAMILFSSLLKIL